MEAYWDIIDATPPENRPDSSPWVDQWGSCGSYPSPEGRGATVHRTRVPAELLPEFWEWLTARYPDFPRFNVGPRDTIGLRGWLQQHQYSCTDRETVMVLDRPQWGTVATQGNAAVRRAETLNDMWEMLTLDHLVFADPRPDHARVAEELARLSPQRQCFLIPGGPLGSARAAGGLTCYANGWALLWGGETHPEFRGQGLYKLVVAARLAAIDNPNIAFVAVDANNLTSAPILERLGFRAIGAREIWTPDTQTRG